MPKISVLVIAHNEEQYIKKCLESLVVQTRKPDEIVLIAHNCTDKTEEIARAYPQIRVVHYEGPSGQLYARIRGFEEVTGDIVVCTDGDSWVSKNWVEEIVKPLSDPKVSGVGTPVIMRGSSWYATLGSLNFFYLRKLHKIFYGIHDAFYFFGASFALRKKDYETVGGFTPFIKIRDEIKLNNWPDDAYIVLALSKIGRIALTMKARVNVHCKQKSSWESMALGKTQVEDSFKLFAYFKGK